MKRKMTKKEIKQEELSKDRIAWSIMFIGIILIIGVFVINVKADHRHNQCLKS